MCQGLDSSAGLRKPSNEVYFGLLLVIEHSFALIAEDSTQMAGSTIRTCRRTVSPLRITDAHPLIGAQTHIHGPLLATQCSAQKVWCKRGIGINHCAQDTQAHGMLRMWRSASCV